MGERIYSSMAYDDAFRTIESECDDVLIYFVNHVFGEDFGRDSTVVRLRNEHFVERGDGSEGKRITDSHYGIRQGLVEKKYHMECESSAYDGSVLVRMFEYDTQAALDEARHDKGTLHVGFPNAGILLLRPGKDVPDKATIVVNTPGGTLEYEVPLIKMSNYGIDDIFENRLYYLLPFYIFNFEKDFERVENDPAGLDSLERHYAAILGRLETDLQNALLSSYSYGVIINTMRRVMLKITKDRKNIQRKVDGIMGGKVMMDIDIVKARHDGLREGWIGGHEEGKAEGRQEGREEGREEGRDALLIEIILKKMRKGKSKGQIADELEESEEKITRIVKVIEDIPTDKREPDYVMQMCKSAMA